MRVTAHVTRFGAESADSQQTEAGARKADIARRYYPVRHKVCDASAVAPYAADYERLTFGVPQRGALYI